MTVRARIKVTNELFPTVKLAGLDPYTGDQIEWEFYTPRGGGYVRLNGRQVCQRLGGMGVTLWVDDAEKLLNTVRREWRLYRDDARRQGFLHE